MLDAKGGRVSPFDPWHFPSQVSGWWSVRHALYRAFPLHPAKHWQHIGATKPIASDLDEAARLNDEAIDAQKAVEVSIAKAHAKAETADKARAKSTKRSRRKRLKSTLRWKLAEAETVLLRFAPKR